MLSTQKTITAGQFKSKFRFPYKDFIEPVEYVDAVGIGVKKIYSNGYASGYGIIIPKQELERDSFLKKLHVHVSYGKNTLDGIILRSKSKLSDPVDVSSGDFFYNIATDKFYFKQKEIRPEDILSIIDKDHMKPTKKILGIPFRCKFWFWNRFLPYSIKALDIFLRVLLRIISGEKVEKDVLGRMVDHYIYKESQQIPIDREYSIPHKELEHIGIIFQGQSMKFFGYESKRGSVVFYCSLHLIIIAILFFYYDVNYKFITEILSNNFYALCYIVVSFAFTERIVPSVIKWLVKSLIEIAPMMLNFVSNKRLRV